MTEIEKRTRARYEELCRKADAGVELTPEELSESVQMLYELHPEHQYWRSTDPDLTPDDIWGMEWRKKGADRPWWKFW